MSRTALKWMLTASAAMALDPRFARGQATTPTAKGYGTDPDLTRHYNAGELWPLTFTAVVKGSTTPSVTSVLSGGSGRLSHSISVV